MLSLVRSLDTMLDAILPKNPYNTVRLHWTDNDIGPAVGCNADIEEQFHIVFGPWLRSDYHEQLEEMLEGIVERANAGRRCSGWVMCSTVRLKYMIGKHYLYSDLTRISIETIFIRPCLQGYSILGKILLYFASNTDSKIGIGISECYSASQNAMDNHYGGSNTIIFSKVEGREIGCEIPYYSYALLVGEDQTFNQSKRLLLEQLHRVDIPYPDAEKMNGRSMTEIPKVEWNWNALALINYKRGLRLEILDCYFKTGVNYFIREYILTERYIDNAIITLERIQNPSKEEISVTNWLKYDDTVLKNDDIYTVNRVVLSEYKKLIAEMDKNIFFRSCKTADYFSKYNRSYLKDMNRTQCLKEAVEVLSSQELSNVLIPGQVQQDIKNGEQKDFASYITQEEYIKKYLKEEMKNTGICALNHFFKVFYTLMSFRIDVNKKSIYFITPPQYENDRLEFLRICPDLIEKIRILSADN